MKKRFVGFLLALLVVSSCFTACSDGSTTTEPPESSAPTSSSTSSTADESTNETEKTGVVVSDIYAECSWGELSWMEDTSPVTFTCYLDHDWYPLDTWGLDDVSQEITRLTGVTLEVTKGSDPNQLGVLLASGELPDIIFTDKNAQRFEDSDICAPWDELIPQYCPEFMDFLDPVEIMNNTKADGHFYTLKTHYNSQEAWDNPYNLPSPGDCALFFRGDILEKIGNPEINSIEDVKEVFATVKERSAELGIDIVYNPHPSWQNAFEEFFGIQRVPFVDGDQVHITYCNPQWKEYLLFMNEMYREGYLNKEYLSARPEDFFQLNKSGKVFAATYNTAVAADTNKIFDEQDIDAYFEPCTTALTVNGENRFEPVDQSVGWCSTFISADAQNLDRLIRFMEFLKSPQGDQLTSWGIRDKHYTVNDEGLIVRTDYFNSTTQQENGVGPWYLQASGLSEGLAIYSGTANPDPVLAGYAQTMVDVLEYKKEYYVRNPALFFARPDADTEEYAIKVKMTEEWDKRTAEIITADSADTAAAKYDEMMAYLESIGLSQYEELITKNYFEALERYK